MFMINALLLIERFLLTNPNVSFKTITLSSHDVIRYVITSPAFISLFEVNRTFHDGNIVQTAARIWTDRHQCGSVVMTTVYSVNPGDIIRVIVQIVLKQ